MVGCASSAHAGVPASIMATASGLAAAARREREEMFIINFPLKPGATHRAIFDSSGGEPPLPTTGISEVSGSETSSNRCTYVFRGVRFHPDAEAADLFRHCSVSRRFAADGVARP